MYSPVVNGLALGSIVEIDGISDGDLQQYNGQIGQLVDYDEPNDSFSVAMVKDGATIAVACTFVKKVALEKSGQGGEEGFDLVIGPKTEFNLIGEEIASCLEEKKFCVIRHVQNPNKVEEAFKAIQEDDDDGKMSRLAVEVEEGYLGQGGRAKVIWLDTGSAGKTTLNQFASYDQSLDRIAEALQPYSEDVLGSHITERTPSLACLCLKASEEAFFENPVPENEHLVDYLKTWRRTLVKVFFFLSGTDGVAILSRKSKAGVIEGYDSEIRIAIKPNTILLLAQDTYDYEYIINDMEGDGLWLQCFYLKQEVTWQVDAYSLNASDMAELATIGEGPPPPAVEHVAVMGMGMLACGSMDSYGHMKACLMGATDCFKEFPMERYGQWQPYYVDDPNTPYGLTFTKHVGYQDGIDYFDNKIFEISPSEAGAMDPQQRMACEVAMMCLHGIGLTKKYCNTHPHHASCSVGCDKSEYATIPGVPFSVAANNQLAINANRLGYVFNLKGGNYVVDTACSSSLVAMHLGKSILMETRWDPIDFHIAIGVNINMTLGGFIHCCGSHMLSPGGRSFTYNASANGYARGDGNSGVLLQNGEHKEDRICLLRGTQAGQDGKSASMSAPNGPAQEKCIIGAIREARMNPPESTAWECHGTGTSLGDPIEIGAVRKVQTRYGSRVEPLMLTTSKSNIGHCEGGAAMMGIMKCIVQVTFGCCMPTLHLKQLNPHLEHAAFEATYDTECIEYPYVMGHAQVSSFGVGGTNGHAIIWGRSQNEGALDYNAMFVKRLKQMLPSFKALGKDPGQWEFGGGLDPGAMDGQKYSVYLDKEAGEYRFEKNFESVGELLPEYYSLFGTNINEGEPLRMCLGELTGVHCQEVEMPASGNLSFTILEEKDKDRILAPQRMDESHMLAAVLGPMSREEATGASGAWLIRGRPHSNVTIEILSKGKGCTSLMWYFKND